jgi:hypothetical protein
MCVFNTDDFFKNIKDTLPITEVDQSKKNLNDLSIDDLISINIAGLFKKANINDDFDKGVYLVHLKKILQKEMAQLRAAYFSDEAPREARLQQIQNKIQQINSYNTTFFVPLIPQAKIVEGDVSNDANRKQLPPNLLPKQKRTRKTNLIRAIEAAVKTFHGKPSLDELWTFFQDEKDDTLYIVDCTHDNITWTDTRGNLKDTKKSTVRNKLSTIKM